VAIWQPSSITCICAPVADAAQMLLTCCAWQCILCTFVAVCGLTNVMRPQIDVCGSTEETWCESWARTSKVLLMVRSA
jgi:hypothetical protein